MHVNDIWVAAEALPVCLSGVCVHVAKSDHRTVYSIALELCFVDLLATISTYAFTCIAD
jgi:hypothetical protein